MAVQAEIERKLTGRMALASRAFLVLAAAGIVAVLAAVAHSQRWFTPTVDLYFYTHTASGLNRGMALKLAGFNVGSLEQVSVEGELRIKGKVAMDRRYRDSVGKDARIRLTKEGLIGASILELIPGPGDPGPVDGGSVLLFEREPDYSQMAAQLLDRVGPVIDDIRGVTARLNDPASGVQQTLRHVDEAAVAVIGMTGNVSELVADGRRLAGEASRLAADGARLTREVPARVEPVLADVQRNLAQLEALLKQLNTTLPPMIDEARRAVQSIRETSDSAQRVIAKDVPLVLRRSESLLEDTEEILGGVRRAWPVRDMLPPSQEKLIELDSADGMGRAVTRGRAP